MKFNQFSRQCFKIFLKKKRGKGSVKCPFDSGIVRGRSPISSSEVEDLLARVVHEVLPEFLVLIDYPITPSHDSKGTIYPDLILTNNGILKGIVETKIDLGYFDENWFLRHDQMKESLEKAQRVIVKRKVGYSNSEEATFTIEGKVDYCVVVLSRENDHGRIEKYKDRMKDWFFLFSEGHPNSYGINIDDKTEIRKYRYRATRDSSGWDGFMGFLKKFASPLGDGKANS